MNNLHKDSHCEHFGMHYLNLIVLNINTYSAAYLTLINTH